MPRSRNTPDVHFKFTRLSSPKSKTHIGMELRRGKAVLGLWHIARTDAARMCLELQTLMGNYQIISTPEA